MRVFRASTSSPTSTGTSAIAAEGWLSYRHPQSARDVRDPVRHDRSADPPQTSWESAAFEVPAQRFVDLSDAHAGVALLADCKHGFSAYEDTCGSVCSRGGRSDPKADIGAHHFTYSLLPSRRLDDVPVRRTACPAAPGAARPGARGPLPNALLACNCQRSARVVVETAKWPRRGPAHRALYEATRPTRTTMSSAPQLRPPIRSILLERNPSPLALDEQARRRSSCARREVKTVPESACARARPILPRVS